MTGSAMYVAAHQDDDLLFCSPDLVHDIDSERGVVTIFVTAGDAGLGRDYWRGREKGIEAAYAQMADVNRRYRVTPIQLSRELSEQFTPRWWGGALAPTRGQGPLALPGSVLAGAGIIDAPGKPDSVTLYSLNSID